MTTFNQPAIGTYDHKFAGIATMMRLPHVESAEGLDIAIAGVPYDMGTFIRPGARFGPAQIRDMSRFIRKVNPATRVAPFDLCQVADMGDAPVNPVDPARTHDRVAAFFAEMAGAGAVPLVAGGDHTVPLMVLRGMQQAGVITEPVGLVHIDAHADVLMTDGDVFEGEETNHATFARLAVEEGAIDPKRSIQIGLRGSQYTADANRFAEETGIAMIYQHEFDDLGPKAVIEQLRDRAGRGPMYFTIDIDGLDPSECPGTGYPEPGGLTMREVQQIMRGARGLDFIGADVCEVNPPLDPAGMTALVGAHLLFEQLCLLAESTARRKGRIE